MYVCWNCSYQHEEQLDICTECGAVNPARLGIDSTLIVKKSESSQAPDDQPVENRMTVATEISIKIGDETLVMPIDQRVVFGRGAQSGNDFRFVDLTRFNGTKYGVSRNHADLRRVGANNLLLVDVGSTNGTRINDEKLTPFKAYKLNHNDKVYFGNLCVTIQLVSVSVKVN